MSSAHVSVTINLDLAAKNLMDRVREAIVEANKDRSAAGRLGEVERATYKHIIQRGIAAVAREVLAAPKSP